MRQFLSVCLIAAMVAGPVLTPAANAANPKTTTPIKHIVIIFGENRSFDHYFGTYPNALNPKGEPQFHALPNTPTVNGLGNALLNNNPNLNPLNGSGAANPFRFDRTQSNTQDMDHDYMAERRRDGFIPREHRKCGSSSQRSAGRRAHDRPSDGLL